MAKWCRTCGRKKHEGICDMATLSTGVAVHVSRLERGGELHELIEKGKLKVTNRWRKPLEDKKKKKESDDGTS